MPRFALACLVAFGLAACTAEAPAPQSPPVDPPVKSSYFDNAGRSDVLSGGVRMIEVKTPKGTFKVWTKRVGNNPRIKLLRRARASWARAANS